jgi:hypothetical protein
LPGMIEEPGSLAGRISSLSLGELVRVP